MGRNDIQDIARIISGKHKLSIKGAEGFLTAFFETLNEGLDDDKLVKVKGFGTFKVIDVKERESIDVNTGERIKIEGRSKITFTPDSVMKDLVNKPFAQFETVVLNEGVDFSDLEVSEPVKEEEPLEPVVIENENDNVATEAIIEGVSQEIGEEKVVEEDNVVEEKNIVEEEKIVEEDNIVEKESIVEEEKTAEEIDLEEARQRYYLRKRKKIIIISTAFVITTIIAFCLGYFIGRKSHLIFPLTDVEEVAEETSNDLKSDFTVVDTVSIEDAKEDSVAAIRAKADSIVKANEAVQQSKKNEKENEEENAVDKTVVEKDNNDDSNTLAAARRIMKYGAYEIVGTETTVTVKKGQTLSKLSKSYFGDGMECYIQVHNGVTEVKEGDKIKIPKLKIKKQKK